jgi:hypothetical protein
VKRFPCIEAIGLKDHVWVQNVDSVTFYVLEAEVLEELLSLSRYRFPEKNPTHEGFLLGGKAIQADPELAAIYHLRHILKRIIDEGIDTSTGGGVDFIRRALAVTSEYEEINGKI